MDHNSYWKIKKKNMRLYDETASTYNRQYREEQARKYKAALVTLGVPKGGYVLDVGCGTGLFIEEAAGFRGYIVGIDSSEKMIKKAKHEYGNRQFFLCADADYLPFFEGTFDKIFSFTLLQNMPYPENTVMEICRVAKGGSEVVLTAPKKAFTILSFMSLFNEEKLVVVKFIDDEELKDYVAICKIL